MRVYSKPSDEITRKVFDIPAIMEILGCSKSSVYRAFHNGLTPRKLGRKTVVTKQDLERYISALPAADFVESASVGR